MQQEELQKSIENFSKALEQGHGAVYRRNYNSDIYEYMGGYIKDITGYTAEELTPELWDSLILQTEHKDDLIGLSLAEANHRVRSGEVDRWQADVQIRTRSGETRWVTDMSTVLRDESGTCFGSLGVMLDITERKETEKQLAELTEKLRVRNQEMADELAMAREIQQTLVSDQPKQFPLHAAAGQARADFHHRYIPAEMLAGDYFNILPLSEHEAGVFICDVVGHGVRAALLTTFLRGLIEELRPQASDPGTLLGKINQSLRTVFCQGESFLFASAFYMVINVATGRIRYANAGHPQPLCLQPKAGKVALLDPHGQACGPALGIIEDFAYSTSEHLLDGTESLLLYTDGLFEAHSSETDEIYGEERVVDFIRKQLHLAPEERMDNLIMDIHRFSGSDTFEDDVCVLAVVPANTI
ncbi:MAG: SpoIIE family protein phosphatase [Verrucomicrobiota bacterium]